MRVLITLLASDVLDTSKTTLPIKAIELVDNYKISAGTSIAFTAPVTGIAYRKLAVDLEEDEYKDEVMNNYDQFVYNKTSGSIVPKANYVPNNRNINNPDGSVPLMQDQYLGLFSL